MWKFTAFASAFALLFTCGPAHSEDGAEAILPPKPEPSKPPGALLVPSRTGTGTEIDRTAVDVLLRTAAERFDVRLVMQAPRADACGHHEEDLSQIRQAYLAMDIDKALDDARALRGSIEADFGDVFDCPALAQAELLSVQMLLDLGRIEEAEKLALKILARRPLLALDPVEHPPKMQALWAELTQRRSAVPPMRPRTDRLRALGPAHDARFVIFGRVFREGVGDVLEITVLDTSLPEPARERVPLSGSSQWMVEVRLALSRSLPSAQPTPAAVTRGPRSPIAAGPGLPDQGQEAEDASPAFYKRWWFWTAVGVALAGAAVGAVAAYSAANKDSSTAVEIDPWKTGAE